MTVVRIVIGSLKVLMVLGIVEHIAPGISFMGTKYLFSLMF